MQEIENDLPEETVEALDEVKETIKFHRSIKSNESVEDEKTNRTESSNQNSRPSAASDIFSTLSSPKAVLSTALNNIFSVTSKL